MNRRERNMLFVPAARWPMIVKASASEADAVCIDLEDSVPTADKEASRANVVRALTELDFGARTRMFRMNAVDTPFAYRDLVEVVEAAGDRIDAVMLPKASSAHDVQFVATLLAQIESRQRFTRQIGVEAQIESAAGVVWIREIANASPRLEALIFGAGDYAASMRMPAAGIGTFDENDDLYPGHRWHAAMHAIVATARAAGLRCIDGPYSDYGDLTGFQRACRIARAMGFDGKQCIHPGQLAAAKAVFTPAKSEIAHARRVVAAYEAGAASGRGAVSLDGKMVDEANVRMARSVLNQIEGTDD
ncbi:MAG: HpcH/HpaI aldolase/citrate lyase family protein [bacterium]